MSDEFVTATPPLEAKFFIASQSQLSFYLCHYAFGFPVNDRYFASITHFKMASCRKRSCRTYTVEEVVDLCVQDESDIDSDPQGISKGWGGRTRPGTACFSGVWYSWKISVFVYNRQRIFSFTSFTRVSDLRRHHFSSFFHLHLPLIKHWIRTKFEDEFLCEE